jgi:hypothetical protein
MDAGFVLERLDLLSRIFEFGRPLLTGNLLELGTVE